MRILILTQYYPPEMGAPQTMLSDLALHLRKLGHTVTVLTALPNYPVGEVFTEYRGAWLHEEHCHGIHIIRTWIYATPNTDTRQIKDFVQRLINYCSFVFASAIVGLWKLGRHDILFVQSPPLFLGLSGFFLSRIKKARMVLNIADLWPASAVAMGILRNRRFIGLAEALESFLYWHSHLITGQTQGIVDSIKARALATPVRLLLNGVNVDHYASASQAPRRQESRRAFDYEHRFVVGYAGLHGLAQGLEIIIQAATILREHEHIIFVLFGDGPEKRALVRQARTIGLTNIRFYPVQPISRMPDVIASFDVALVPLRRLDLFKGALPTKLFEAMAAAVPLVISIDGEARQLVETAQAGIYVEPGDSQGMAEALMRLSQEASYRFRLGQNGQRYVAKHCHRRHIAQELERLLLATLSH